jgi:hypothetical protein
MLEGGNLETVNFILCGLLLFRRVYKISERDYYFRHVSLSVCPFTWENRVPLGGRSWNLIFENFSKICQDKPSLIKSDKNGG